MFIIIPYTIVIIAEIDWQHLYVNEEFTRNQLRRCNVPPNHRPACSSISQQRCHPRAGHDSSGIRVNCRLIHSQGDINNKPTQLGFTGFQQPSQASTVRRLSIALRQPISCHSLKQDNTELFLALSWPKQLSNNTQTRVPTTSQLHKENDGNYA